MAIIPEFFLDAVVAIGVPNMNGANKKSWAGTGFLVGRAEDDGKSSVYLITNRHVICNYREMFIKFNKTGTNTTKDYPLYLYNADNITPNFSPHHNPRVDIVAVRINPNILSQDNSTFAFFALELHALILNDMKSTGVIEGSLVYALGFPMNLVGERKKIPICRLGCISRISDLFDDQSDLRYLVDAQVFPGNSGGPIISRPESLHIEGTTHNDKACLIGILSAYIPYKEQLCSSQTGEVRSVTTENSGLTVVFPVDLIKETVEIERARFLKSVNVAPVTNNGMMQNAPTN